ncbi:MAG TPA: 30S ribosome-binding factor RbfA [Aggregatilineales bacterium]|nr:30S ribosome-binding factor RbfA [Aggregatilineales bacterium]
MSIKQERLSERIREILSELLLTEVTDPALQGLTVTEVTLDPELEYAEVYVNALGDEGRQKDVMAGLRRANGFLRREVGRRVRVRRTPYLRFHWDETLTRAEHIEHVLDSLPEHQNPATQPDRGEEAGDGLE